MIFKFSKTIWVPTFGFHFGWISLVIIHWKSWQCTLALLGMFIRVYGTRMNHSLSHIFSINWLIQFTESFWMICSQIQLIQISVTRNILVIWTNFTWKRTTRTFIQNFSFYVPLKKVSHRSLEQHEVQVNDKMFIFGWTNHLRLSPCCFTTKGALCRCSGVGGVMKLKWYDGNTMLFAGRSGFIPGVQCIWFWYESVRHTKHCSG